MTQIYAQTDTTHVPEARVSDQRLEAYHADVEYETKPGRDYDDIVFRLPINFRSGGINDFASVSIRGAGIHQTKILWNGIPMNSALNGLADVSVLGSSFGSRVSLYTTGDGALMGDQAVGGLITVREIFDTSTGVHAQVHGQYASYRNIGTSARIDCGRDRAQYYLSASHQQGRNDYPFPYKENRFWLNAANQNADTRSTSIKWGMRHRRERTSHRLDYWYFDRLRSLSPLNNTPSDSSYIAERFHRLALNSIWQWNPDFVTRTTVGLTQDALDYTRPRYDLHSPNMFRQIILNTSTTYQNYVLATELLYSSFVEQASSDLTMASLGLQRLWQLSDAHLLYTTLKGVYFRDQVSVVPSLRYRYTRSASTLGLDLSRVYRNPTINELYFRPGGNPNLRPESGWNTTISWDIAPESSQLDNMHIALYSRWIRDWVLWYGSFVFSPYNIGEVWSRGIECIADFSILERPRQQWTANANMTYVLSTLQHTEDSYFEDIIGEQLPYTPSFLANATLQGQIGSFQLEWRHHYQSARTGLLTSTWRLEPFYIMDISLCWSGHWNSSRVEARDDFSFGLGLKNVTNTYYEYIMNRPMPGRNFSAEFSVFL